MNLSAIDINLLVVLDALLDSASVTRAGQRVGLSQPATSHALSRLRELFGDELLVRHGRRMVLTPRAEQIAAALPAWRQNTERLLASPAAFEPASASGTWRIAVSDYAMVTVVGPAIADLHRQAPGMRLATTSLNAESLVERLGVDLDAAVVLGGPARLPSELDHAMLGADEFVCVVRDGHPHAGASLTLDAYCATPHLLISPRGDFEGVVDDALRTIGRTRHVAMVVPTFYAAPPIVAATDLLLNMNRRYATAVSSLHGLRLLEPPLALPVGRLRLLWHRRFASDPMHRWAREAVSATIRGLLDPSPSRETPVA